LFLGIFSAIINHSQEQKFPVDAQNLMVRTHNSHTYSLYDSNGQIPYSQVSTLLHVSSQKTA